MEENHAYVLPSECIKMFLAKGHKPMLFDNKTIQPYSLSLRDTPRGEETATHLAKSTGYENVHHYPLAFFEWKDDCKPSILNKKSKFGSLWIWTITILNMAKKDTRRNISYRIGYSKDDQDNLERIIGNDIKRMSEHKTLTFVGSRDGNMIEEVAFSAQIFLTIGNQPERRGGKSLLGGKSQSHRGCAVCRILGSGEQARIESCIIRIPESMVESQHCSPN
jgi:hypothetical protein